MTGAEWFAERIALDNLYGLPYGTRLEQLFNYPSVVQGVPGVLGGPCVRWLGPTVKDGYGQLWVTTPFGMREKVYVHRYAMGLVRGRFLAPEEKALHRCDNPPCFNVFDHLWVGTTAENNQDMSDKGRNVAQRPGQNAGERNNHARLTWAMIREMRLRWKLGAFPSKMAGALAYEIHPSTFGDIVEHRTWWPDPEGDTP